MQIASTPQRGRDKAIASACFFMATVLICVAIALFRIDALDLPENDPSPLEFWFGAFNVVLSLPLLLSGAAFLANWPKKTLWIAMTSVVFLLAAYSLWTTRNWLAA